MTAGTKAILLLSVFGLVVLVACYGDGPATTQSNQASGRSTDPLLVSASEISSPRERIPAQTPPVRQPRPIPPAAARPAPATGRSLPPAMAGAVQVVRDTPQKTPTFTMGAPRTSGIKAPPPAGKSNVSRAGAGVARSTGSPSAVSSRAAERTDQSRPVQAKKSVPVEAVTVHVIKPGDTLGHIAQRYYGSARQWSRIADANPNVDVDSLRVGQKLKIPARGVSGKSARGTVSSKPALVLTGRTHTIDDGETLSSIAEDHLGDQSYWYRIYELNKERIGNSPDRLVVGMVIAVPE